MSEEVETGKMTLEMVAALMARPVIARLATCSKKTHRPHVVPVWFLWDGSAIWISSFRSTRKVVDLQENPFCSIAVDTAESGVDFEAVILEGQAELVTGPEDFLQDMTTRIYTRYLGPEGVLAPDPQSWIHDPENLLIKLAPKKIMSWYSAQKMTSAEG
jgi:nitroimidazol reductase NimA-like FMN-containing flavoprotein (pyridoxamine 5'-phosphate oxidase superfamily)